ncbi:hypothetical protein [Clostridium beijerinckii]|uniref:hypothetical protein n=1 Tax=Clostridium beijerinckii TaxID=1520 RepID=UPI0022E0CC47|nr:hypothetical protein [Clostridium beijerinckii]
MISTEFKQNVQSRDLVTVRSALVDYLIIDRSFKSFDEALGFAQESLDILQSYDGESFETEPEKWDKNYLNRQKVALMVNFSQERIRHIKMVVEKVLPRNTEMITKNSVKTSKNITAERKTGRTVLSERSAQQPCYTKSNNSQSKIHQNTVNQDVKRTSNGGSSSGKTGKRVVKETTSETKRTEEKVKSDTDNLGKALIFGGVAVAAVGVAVVEPIIIGTGVVMAGAGVGVNIKNKK